MGLSPIKPRDDSPEEKQRYKRDLKHKKEHPHEWGITPPTRPPKIDIQADSEETRIAMQQQIDDLWVKLGRLKRHEVVAYAKDVKANFSFHDSTEKIMRRILQHEFGKGRQIYQYERTA